VEEIHYPLLPNPLSNYPVS